MNLPNDIIVWAKRKREEASDLYEEAEESRVESEYTDIDALEQSVYNQAVMDVTTELLAMFGVE